MTYAISIEDYFKGFPSHSGVTDGHKRNASDLLTRVNKMLAEAEAAGVVLRTHRETGTFVSTHDGGWRPKNHAVGAEFSSHKEGKAVDVCDVYGNLDEWLTDELLEKFDLYREHPASTRTWCHVTTRRPNSGRRTFYP